MSADPSKPSSSSRRLSGSSRRDRDQDRRQRIMYDDRDSHRNRDRDRDRRRTRSLSPVAASSRRARTEGSRKGKEPVHDDFEPGEVEQETKTYDIGDDFIPFEDNDGEVSAEEVRRSDKGKAPEREWDKGKPPRYDDNHLGGRGSKRKRDDLSDNDDRGRRRTEWQVQSRSAPWVVNVDWGNCRNIAEVYVCFHSHSMALSTSVSIGCTPKWQPL